MNSLHYIISYHFSYSFSLFSGLSIFSLTELYNVLLLAETLDSESKYNFFKFTE